MKKTFVCMIATAMTVAVFAVGFLVVLGYRAPAEPGNQYFQGCRVSGFALHEVAGQEVFQVEKCEVFFEEDFAKWYERNLVLRRRGGEEKIFIADRWRYSLGKDLLADFQAGDVVKITYPAYNKYAGDPVVEISRIVRAGQ